MNRFLLLIFVGFNLFSQSQEVYSITYDLEFKPYKNLPSTFEYVRTYICNNKSIYQSYNGFLQDTLLAANNSEFNRLKGMHTFILHSITIDNNDIRLDAPIGNKEYFYHEKINMKWNILKQFKDINGYKCQKASTSYGGRTWEAWFTKDIPINAGPYKFKGLPGLILEISDTTQSYIFKFYSFKKRDWFNKDFNCNFKRLFYSNPLDEVIETNRDEFNNIQYQYSSMSLNEKMNYQNPGKSISLGIRMSGEETVVETSRISVPNPIEIDHLD